MHKWQRLAILFSSMTVGVSAGWLLSRGIRTEDHAVVILGAFLAITSLVLGASVSTYSPVTLDESTRGEAYEARWSPGEAKQCVYRVDGKTIWEGREIDMPEDVRQKVDAWRTRMDVFKQSFDF